MKGEKRGQLLKQVAQEKCSYSPGLRRVPGGRGCRVTHPTLTQAWGTQCKTDPGKAGMVMVLFFPPF